MTNEFDIDEWEWKQTSRGAAAAPTRSRPARRRIDDNERSPEPEHIVDTEPERKAAARRNRKPDIAAFLKKLLGRND